VGRPLALCHDETDKVKICVVTLHEDRDSIASAARNMSSLSVRLFISKITHQYMLAPAKKLEDG
jgi:hypothetical protein